MAFLFQKFQEVYNSLWFYQFSIFSNSDWRWLNLILCMLTDYRVWKFLQKVQHLLEIQGSFNLKPTWIVSFYTLGFCCNRSISEVFLLSYSNVFVLYYCLLVIKTVLASAIIVWEGTLMRQMPTKLSTWLVKPLWLINRSKYKKTSILNWKSSAFLWIEFFFPIRQKKVRQLSHLINQIPPLAEVAWVLLLARVAHLLTLLVSFPYNFLLVRCGTLWDVMFNLWTLLVDCAIFFSKYKTLKINSLIILFNA